MLDDEPYARRIRWLGLSLEKGTAAVPDDGRFHVLHGAKIHYSSSSLTLAQAHLEVLVDEIKAANPGLKDPREMLAKERGFNDILSVRGDARHRARSQQESKGGKGGRSGV